VAIHLEKTIRSVLAEYAKLPVDIDSVDADTDLYTLGLTSHASVNVMLGLEDAFEVEFPDTALRKDTFRSIGTIAETLRGLNVPADS
jgi:acyl carrier protein